MKFRQGGIMRENDIILDTPEKIHEFIRIWQVKIDEDNRQINMMIEQNGGGGFDANSGFDAIDLQEMQFDHESFPEDSKEFFQELDKILSMMGVKTSKANHHSIYHNYPANQQQNSLNGFAGSSASASAVASQITKRARIMI